MTSWQTKKLGQIAEVQTGPFGAQLHEKDYVKVGGTPIITVENLVGGVVKLLPGTPKVSNEDKKRLSRYVLSEGDIVFSRVGAVDRSAYVTNDSHGWMFSGRLLRVHPGDEIDAKYLNYHLSDERTKNLIRNLAVGGTMPSLNTEILNFVPINYPEKSEQERIVGVLEVWDKYIEKLEQNIALKEQLKKGLMQQLLTGKYRLPGFSGKWNYVTLNHFASQSKNAIVDGPFGSQMKLSEFTTSGVPVIEMHHLKNTYINEESLTRFVSDEKFKKDLKRSGVYGGDIIISKTGSLGYLGLMKDGESAVITSRLAKITLDQGKADRGFVFQYLKYIKMIGYWERIGQGGTMKILSIDNFKKMPIPGISYAEQDQVASVLTLADKEIDALRNKRLRIVDQKKYLLKNLIKGTIRTPENLAPKGANS